MRLLSSPLLRSNSHNPKDAFHVECVLIFAFRNKGKGLIPINHRRFTTHESEFSIRRQYEP